MKLLWWLIVLGLTSSVTLLLPLNYVLRRWILRLRLKGYLGVEALADPYRHRKLWPARWYGDLCWRLPKTICGQGVPWVELCGDQFGHQFGLDLKEPCPDCYYHR